MTGEGLNEVMSPKMCLTQNIAQSMMNGLNCIGSPFSTHSTWNLDTPLDSLQKNYPYLHVVDKEINEIVSFYKISPIFWTFCFFRPLNLISWHKFYINRFSIAGPTRPCSGLPVTLVQKLWLIVALLTTHHHTSPCFFLVGREGIKPHNCEIIWQEQEWA